MVSSSRFEREPEGAVLELEQLVDRGAGQPGDPGDAVTDLDDPADLLGARPPGCTPPRGVFSAAVISLASIVSSAINLLPLSVSSYRVIRTPPLWKPLSSQPGREQVLP